MLTAMKLRAIKPNGKIQNHTDGGGLYLRVSAAGKMTWRLEYAVNGRRSSATLGEYPEMSLAEARNERGRIKADAKAGVIHAPKPAAPEQATTFGDMASLYLASLKKKDPAAQTLQKNTWLLETLAEPLHRKPIADIRARDILPIIEGVAHSGRRESAVRLRGRIGAVFDLAIVRGEIEMNPVSSLKAVLPRVEVESTAAITDEQEFGKLLAAIEGYPDPSIRHALQLQAFCYPRPVETRMARWSNIDLKEAVWTIPKEVAKMRREHLIPLSAQAVAVFQAQQEISGDNDFVFPNRYRNKHPMISENAMNYALQKLGYGKGVHTAHGFRSSASTILNERGWRFDVIEASLAHVDMNAVRCAYNRALYWKERVEMATAWAALCEEFKRRGKRKLELEEII
ncbi:tyrosine-type recombinase/integrase [Jiella marina]|uniref:tyrosine-type recombinase/integrase n=1 Tax=Jiella sp. LLJ827 TaxID=2917712 RepID=UPI0021007568|nr:tyrosine-type recombinase/integrase [Jiella sp. LLJ827]MCQ0987153.1 tyrosine-type recombinase/integrase [Jiella sp. LLJ827]